MNYHTEGIVAGKFQYAICTTEKAYKKELRWLRVNNPEPSLLPGSDATVHYFDKENGQNIAILRLSLLDNHLSIIGLLAHEAYHIHRYNMQLLREDSPGEEVAAYCIQMILQTLINEVATVKLKFKK